MTEAEYRAHPAISRSQLAMISESPEKFKYNLEHPKPATPALLLGQVLHKLVLEPETFEEEFAVCPVVDRRTKIGKELFAEFEESAKGKTVVPAEIAEQAGFMRDALLANPFVVKLLNGEREKEFFWSDDLTGEECKCRTDVLTRVGGKMTIVDVKTTTDASTDAFMRSAINYLYDLQSGMYCEGVKKVTGEDPDFVFIAVEKEAPYAVNILKADKTFIQRGYDIFREFIGIYHDCKTTGNWWGYLGKHDIINNLTLPAYLAKEV